MALIEAKGHLLFDFTECTVQPKGDGKHDFIRRMLEQFKETAARNHCYFYPTTNNLYPQIYNSTYQTISVPYKVRNLSKLGLLFFKETYAQVQPLSLIGVVIHVVGHEVHTNFPSNGGTPYSHRIKNTQLTIRAYSTGTLQVANDNTYPACADIPYTPYIASKMGLALPRDSLNPFDFITSEKVYLHLAAKLTSAKTKVAIPQVSKTKHRQLPTHAHRETMYIIEYLVLDLLHSKGECKYSDEELAYLIADICINGLEQL